MDKNLLQDGRLRLRSGLARGLARLSERRTSDPEPAGAAFAANAPRVQLRAEYNGGGAAGADLRIGCLDACGGRPSSERTSLQPRTI